MKMPKKCYWSKQIPTHGFNKIYYYHLTSIVIDYMVKFSEYNKEWDRVTKMEQMLKIKPLSCYWCKEQQVAMMINIILTRNNFAFIAECIGRKNTAKLVDNKYSTSCKGEE